jgi:hypothetical protein
LASTQPAYAATSTTIDFATSGYTVGQHSPSDQNQWSGGGTDWDYGLVENTDFPSSGLAPGRSLRLSNAVSPASTRYLQTPEIESAGEPTTATWNTFEAEFTVASATGTLQPGLNVDVNLDSASRYGGVLNLRHTDAGLAIGSFWVPENAVDATTGSWRSAVFTTVDATVPHDIRIVAVFRADRTDDFDVYVDGVLVSGGSGATTWEHYSRITNGGGDRTVNELSFKIGTSAPSASGMGYEAGQPTAPATNGAGLLIAGIGYSVSNTTDPSPTPTPTPTPSPTPAPSAPPLPTEQPALPAQVDPAPDTVAEIPSSPAEPGGTISFSASGFAPFENVFVTFFSTPVFGGWFQADATGTVVGTVRLPAALDPGVHSLQLTGQTSGWTAVSTFQLAALANSGSSDLRGAALVGMALLGLGGAALGVRAVRRRRPASPGGVAD